jgi:hypothetical protein
LPHLLKELRPSLFYPKFFNSDGRLCAII